MVVLGNLSPAKGLNVVAACAEDAQRRALPLTFRVLGSTTEPIPQFPDVPLSIVGQYDDAKLAQLLAAEQADVLLFAAQVPETYAYTMTVALQSGLPIVASDLGAFTERLAGHPRAVTVPWDAPAAGVECRAPGGRRRQRPAAGARRSAARDSPARGGALMDPVRYAALYTAALPAGPRARRAAPALPLLVDRHFHFDRAIEQPPLTLPQLYAAGVECGHTEARQELKRRVAAAQAELETFRAVRDRAQGDREELAAELIANQRCEHANANARRPGRRRSGQGAPAHRRARIVARVAHDGAAAPLRHRAKVLVARARARLARAAATAPAGGAGDDHRQGRGAARARAAHRAQGSRAARRSGRRRARRSASKTAVSPLSFAASEAPRVSIVVPVYGKPLLTFTCLKSVQAHSPAGRYEVIVVDDASPEPSAGGARRRHRRALRAQ